ncbi:1-deoxy-D-xylulose-5-phosphate synthase [Marinobacterium nitratireducens]|uniref:1-deoxy-D-xylulose-5-phosphate synthase n=1 Tax=Marinobacterium nitratireducens TaxID=518897 RepID=A0A917Z929_9GAMM|nr:1-deoxy-D-xylulose-5-phosphate synthase [Marinobacterium nitratireducens]GGO78410.1 1-deoxy-D-xylulose-5-phosphate synthase [Marinobacterium nitratireducens]
MFRQIPLQRPSTPLLDSIDQPSDLRRLDRERLPELAHQLRAFLLYSVGQTGGHFGAGLGVVELTIALHYLLDTPDDHLVWDVGHQCYPHKILCGRREQMSGMRQQHGLAPFPKRAESRFDDFGTGHSSTSISAVLGMALADRLQGLDRRSVAVIGDGAMTAGMAFEALNHAGHTGANLLVILNDNDMSISHNEGGLATYLAKNLKSRTDREVAAPLFEALEFAYTGPVDGHDFDVLLPNLQRVLNSPGPQFLHIVTRKGKGFAPAEADPVGYHAITKIEPVGKSPRPSAPQPAAKPKYANIFGRWLCDLAEDDRRVVGITPAMREGSDLIAFSERFPDRYFDVAIAEQHALTLAAGLACGGMKPVVAIYSTFLQRGYDQLVHDIAIQELDVLLAVDRAGLVGEDGATHAGVFDIALLRTLPGLVVMTPADEPELRAMLQTGYDYPGPAAVRYPRGGGPGLDAGERLQALPLGRSRTLREGSRAAILNFGPLLSGARAVAEALDLTLVDMRFVKPLDEARIRELSGSHRLLVTLEDHALAGGAGSAVAEFMMEETLAGELLCLGIPDRWIEHGSRDEQLEDCGLSVDRIRQAIEAKLG